MQFRFACVEKGMEENIEIITPDGSIFWKGTCTEQTVALDKRANDQFWFVVDESGMFVLQPWIDTYVR
jgi:hypothetical protein